MPLGSRARIATRAAAENHWRNGPWRSYAYRLLGACLKRPLEGRHPAIPSLSEQRPGAVMAQRDRTAEVTAAFEWSWSSIRRSRGWWPSVAEVRCARLRREAGGATAALATGEFVESLGASLRRWQAFRGVAFDTDRFAASLRNVAPLLSRWEDTTTLTLRAAETAELFELFEALRDIKPTERRWVATSKTLHHLLPDLILPMDNLITAPFLGRSSLPASFQAAFLADVYEAFIELGRDRAIGIGARRVRAAAREVPFPLEGERSDDCRVGLSRVLDFAIAGVIPDAAGRARLRSR